MLETFTTLAPQARLTQQYGGTLGVILFNGSASSLVRLLAVPVRPAPIWIPPVDGLDHAQFEQPAPLLDLPIELLWRIFQHAGTIQDVLGLGLAYPSLRGIAQRQLQDHFRQLFGRWANHNIVCAGEYVEAHDFPPGLFSIEDLEVLRQREHQAYSEDTEETIWIAPTSLHDFTSGGVSDIQKEPCMRGEIFRLREYLSMREWCTSADMVNIGLRPRSDREFFPTNEPWILRNLTQKQFVRAEAIALKPEFIHGPDINILGFSEVLLSRICWSSSPAFGIEDPTNICRGVWAGHRFDITTLARHREKTAGENDWVDVSDEVAQEIATIWQSNLGADWREFLCEFG
ncbi:hypothetical protein TASIC1_0002032800 [Trichoderma asperellum]|uniref:F-box domain-containing protein n=1 Tax=Trichoderma asperellum TaxID=101201 RepID=A0A6V8QKX6_TRIAP|nr:hypothetical protein TASIC1_0002032800 [Trichoderma asperellum]